MQHIFNPKTTSSGVNGVEIKTINYVIKENTAIVGAIPFEYIGFGNSPHTTIYQ